jgi:hypothetical protein
MSELRIETDRVASLGKQLKPAVGQLAIASRHSDSGCSLVVSATSASDLGSNVRSAAQAFQVCWGNDVDTIMTLASNLGTFMAAYSEACADVDVSGRAVFGQF